MLGLIQDWIDRLDRSRKDLNGEGIGMSIKRQAGQIMLGKELISSQGSLQL